MNRLLERDANQPDDKLPSGWAWVPVESLAANRAGALTDGPFGSNLKTSHYTERGPRVIRLQNIGDGIFYDEKAHVPQEHFERLRKHEALSQDVVVAMLGERLPRACLVPDHVGPAIVKADCARLRVDSRIALPGLVAAGLNSQAVRQQADELIHGVGRPRLGLGWLKTLRFPLAPVPEQHRIVRAIESYFTRLDDAVATLQRVRLSLNRYRASVLKAAVQGRLVPTEAELARAEGRDYEHASVLLQSILDDRRRRWEETSRRGQYQEPVAPDTTDLPELPAGWCWASLQQLLREPLTNGRSVPDAPSGFPVLRLTALKGDQVDLSERKIGQWSPHEARAFLVNRGDFLVARGNGSIRLVGRGGLVTVDPDPVAFPDTLIRVRVEAAHFSPRLLAVLWNSPLVRLHIERRAKTTAGIHKVNQADLELTPLPLAPRLEQERLLTELDRCFSIGDGMLDGMETQERRCSRLRQSILKWAFEGRLVDQDPSDEPASTVLERIRKETAGQEASPPNAVVLKGHRRSAARVAPSIRSKVARRRDRAATV